MYQCPSMYCRGGVFRNSPKTGIVRVTCSACRTATEEWESDAPYGKTDAWYPFGRGGNEVTKFVLFVVALMYISE